jgi:hypothetical protein
MAKVKKDTMGSMSGLKASNKRVGPVDPQGAWTKVQEATLAGAKGKAKLTKDKELGATSMAKNGRSEKQFGLDKKQKATKEVNPASFRKAALKRESELMEKRSGEMAPKLKMGKKK